MAGRARSVSLGALCPDTARCILVVSDDGALAVALRERIEPRQALIRDVRSGEAGHAAAACSPYPWMIVGEGDMPPVIVGVVRAHPVIARWRWPLPHNVPRSVIAFHGFLQLMEATQRALENTVAGMRLAAGEGVELPDGTCIASAPLQALVAAHPTACPLSAARARSLSSLLDRHRVPVEVVRTGGLAGLRLR
jgi:hypothetical protein